MRIAFWHITFSLFFAALMLLGLSWLAATGRLTAWVPLGDFLLMALAIMRLTRLFTYDLITAFVRDWFAGAPSGTFGGTLRELLNCPWCTGLWFSFVVVFAYFATPYAWPVILILALAGVASTLQIAANLLGWSAEYKKRVVQGPEHKSTSTCG